MFLYCHQRTTSSSIDALVSWHRLAVLLNVKSHRLGRPFPSSRSGFSPTFSKRIELVVHFFTGQEVNGKSVLPHEGGSS